jgi:putative GTP pyrophosphokinase
MCEADYIAYYGDEYEVLQAVEEKLRRKIDSIEEEYEESPDQPIVHYKTRIKKPDSLMAKLEERGYGTSYEDALAAGFHDIVGGRIVCAFTDDIYTVKKHFLDDPMYRIVAEKDYIARPKESGYRSLHLIMEIESGIGRGMLVEVQIRTSAMDFWSTLEHRVRYKRDMPDERALKDELKRCADTIASLDIDMRAIRDIIRESGA